MKDSFIINYLKKEDISIDFEEFLFQVETHPEYPSLYAYSDTLKFFRIDSLVANCPKENLAYLPDNFVAVLEEHEDAPFFALIEKKDDKFRYSAGKKKNVELEEEDFLNIWQGIILVIEQTENAKIKTKNTNNVFRNTLLVLSAFIFIFSIGVQNDFSYALYAALILNLLGLYLTYEVLKQIFGVKSSFASAVCGSTKSSKESNCKTIINSKGSHLLFKLELSDLCVIYFSGHLISFYIMSVTGLFESFLNLSLLTSFLSIPFIIYSLNYQFKKEKKWCAMCLMIAGTLVLEFTLYSLLLNFKPDFNVIDIKSVLFFLFGFLLSLPGWQYAKNKLSEYFNIKSNNFNLIKFKRNYKLFKLTLIDSLKVDYSTLESELVLGNPDSKLAFSIITNPFCGYCKEMHSIIEEILMTYADNVRINIRFNLDVDNDRIKGEVRKVHLFFLKTYFEQGDKAFVDLFNQWYNKIDLLEWITDLDQASFDNKYVETLRTQQKQNISNDLIFTPTIFINEFLYPSSYDRKDILYFISEIIEDEFFDNDKVSYYRYTETNDFVEGEV